MYSTNILGTFNVADMVLDAEDTRPSKIGINKQTNKMSAIIHLIDKTEN